MSIFSELLLFFFSLAFLLLVPGYFLILAIFGKKTFKLFCPIEILTITFATSLIAFDFLIIFFGKIGFEINKILILSITSLFALGCYLIFKFKKDSQDEIKEKKIRFPKFSHLQSILIILILFLTIFIKTAYLKDAIFPTATDLGHHMYWSKLIAATGQLPDYRKNEIISNDNGDYQIQSEPIADFIIGEHLIFSGVNILTKIPFNSYFPALILFSVNIISLLAMFILSLRIFDSNFLKNNFDKKIINSANLSILTLFLTGPIYAIASPQAKFVSGGVIGNLVGNLLIPLCLYFFYRALKEKDAWMLFMGLFLSAGLFYTHHLSGFIFLFILAFIFAVFNLFFIVKIFANNIGRVDALILNYKKLFSDLKLIILRPQIILFFTVAILFLIFVYTPTYLSPSATATAVGAPSKSTRAGLTLEQFKYAVGELRLTFGIIGIFILSLLPLFKKNNSSRIDYLEILSSAILVGWASCLFFMASYPNWLHINLPSDRVANYANFPFVFLSAFGLLYFIYLIKNLRNTFFISKKIAYLIFILVFSTFIFSGYYDNSQALSDGQKSQKSLQTFHVSKFLAQQLQTSGNVNPANVLKDHNYISTDSWIKLFFMQDYNYPYSRGFFKRYEDVTKPREMCTLWMISEPASPRAEQCFSDTHTKYIIVDTSVDGPQFKASANFFKVYESDSLSIFSKK